MTLTDTRERYAYRFAGQQVATVQRALACGDYGITHGERLVAAVERKSLPDLVSSLLDGTLRHALAELAALPRAAVVVEERYSQVFKLEWVRPAMVADGLAELQVRWPGVPIVFTQTRQLAEQWTYRYLAAAHAWAQTELAVADRLGIATDLDTTNRTTTGSPSPGTSAEQLSTAQVRAWARSAGLAVADRGRLLPEVCTAWPEAHRHSPSSPEQPDVDGS